MISNRGYTAIIYCDGCMKELSQGPYPADAEDNIGPECNIVSGDEERPNEHYCAKCYANNLILKEE